MAPSNQTIESFHDDIVQWRKQGMGLRPITKLLQERGLDIKFNVVDRYCRSHGIEKTDPVDPAPQTPSTDARPEPEPMPPAESPLFPSGPTSPPPSHDGSTKSARTPANTPVLQGVRAGTDSADAAASQTKAPPEITPPNRPPPGFVVESATASSLQRPPIVLDAGVLVLPQVAARPKSAPSSAPTSDAYPKQPQSEKPTAPPATTIRVPPVQWRYPPPLFTPLARVPDWTHNLELLRFGAQDVWALQDAFEGVFILGATGSGKTTGSGKAIAETFLSCGFGGLVLTVKPDEAALWEAYARKIGRQEQLCIVRAGGKYRFNFLDYESRRPGAGGGLIENLVSLFYTIIDARAQGQNDSQLVNFWTNAGKELVRNTFRVLTLATPTLSLDEARRFIIESPQKSEDTDVEAGAWFESCMRNALAAAKGTTQEAVMKAAVEYWHGSFLRLAPQTRSCIVSAFSAMADVFTEPAINELFCGETTITPEAALDGAIIVIDLPLKNYDAVGLFAQSIWKYLFQKAIERRSDPEDAIRRPVFLWIDEAQYFHTSYDALFQSTARSSRCSTVYLTQNISNFYGIAGSSRSRERVDGFLGNLNTKIFHCNNDHTSNVWAAEQIGKCQMYRHSTSINEQPRQQGGGWFSSFFQQSHTTNVSSQQHVDYAVQPSEFLNLRTGGERFDYLVDAYFVKGGAVFSTGRHYFPTVFPQEFP